MSSIVNLQLNVASCAQNTQPFARHLELDALRGIIMLLMLLDHTMILVTGHEFHEGINSVPDLNISFWQYFCRFWTHLCAPGFFLLLGAGIWFSLDRAKQHRTLIKTRQKLLQRGLLLIVLQFVLENPIWWFSPVYRGDLLLLPYAKSNTDKYLYVGVLFGIGCAIIICTWLYSKCSKWLLLSIAIASFSLPWLLIAAFPNITDIPLWSKFLILGGQCKSFYINYPIIPWSGVTVLGGLFAMLIISNKQKTLLFTAIIAVVLLVFIISFRVYQYHFVETIQAANPWLSILFITKYPPSLPYLLITFSILGILLYCINKKIESFLIVAKLGRVALPFYFAHLFCLSVLSHYFHY